MQDLRQILNWNFRLMKAVTDYWLPGTGYFALLVRGSFTVSQL
jgi:hypothetical protein